MENICAEYLIFKKILLKLSRRWLYANLRIMTIKKSELHAVRQVTTANWLIAFCTGLAEIIRKVLTINDTTKIIHNPYSKA
jgi:hypothetical protein